MQNQFNNWTKQLADNFLINSSSIQEPGLYNGKMGAAICLFECYKISGNEIYEICARELISQLFELIPSRMPFDFENGLTGIGWGIEYLAQYGFIGNEKNLILDEIDKRLFVAILKSRTLMSNSGIYGAGIYFIQRIKPFKSSEPNLFEKNKIQLASYLRDDCERLLCRNAQFVFNTPELNMEQVNSIIYFYSEMIKYKFIAINTERLLDYLIWFMETIPHQMFDFTNIHTLNTLLNRLFPKSPETAELDKIEFVQDKLQKLFLKNKVNSGFRISNTLKIYWNSVAYCVHFNKIKT